MRETVDRTRGEPGVARRIFFGFFAGVERGLL
jgi:hypothetical protein